MAPSTNEATRQSPGVFIHSPMTPYVPDRKSWQRTLMFGFCVFVRKSCPFSSKVLSPSKKTATCLFCPIETFRAEMAKQGSVCVLYVAGMMTS